jgi:hypothetical protein
VLGTNIELKLVEVATAFHVREARFGISKFDDKHKGGHMRNIMLIGTAVMLCLLPAVGQDQPKAGEVFGGYQFVHFDSINANGWNGAITGNVNRWLGVTGDFSGTYKGGGRLYSYMGGPTFSLRTKRVTPFTHVLFGGATACESGCGSAFTMALGGGLDVNASNRFALRLVQADWMLFRAGGFTDKKNVRVSTGVVFRF